MRCLISRRSVDAASRQVGLAVVISAFLILGSVDARAQDPEQDKSSAIKSVLTIGQGIAKGVLSKAGGEAFGWALGLLGLNSNPDQKIEQEIAALSQQIAALATQLDGVETSVIAVYKQEIDNEAQDKINALDAQIAVVQPYWTTYTTILAAGTATESQLSTLATGVTSDIASALDAIDLILTTNASGQEGLIEVYADVISQNMIPTVGDTEYYSQIYDVMAYYNQWRLNAVTLLVEAYHYQATAAVSGADPSTVCQNPPGPAVVPCGEAATYASRFFNPSSANPESGVIHQFIIAGGSMLSDSTLPIVGVQTEGGVPAPDPLLLWTGTSKWLIPSEYPLVGELIFDWDPAPSAWVSYSASGTAGWPTDSSGYTDWRFVSMDNVSTLYSAASSSDTLWDALSPYLAEGWPNTVTVLLPSGTSSNLWLAEWDGVGQCYMYQLTLNSTDLKPVCVKMTVPSPPLQMTVDGPFGPFKAECPVDPGPNPCELFSFGWSGGQGAPLFWTDPQSCLGGVSGVNAAGWLKPCGNLWVTDRYGSYFPPPQNQAAMDAAIAARDRAVGQGRQ